MIGQASHEEEKEESFDPVSRRTFPTAATVTLLFATFSAAGKDSKAFVKLFPYLVGPLHLCLVSILLAVPRAHYCSLQSLGMLITKSSSSSSSRGYPFLKMVEHEGRLNFDHLF